MKLVINQSLEYKEIEITINCGLIDENLEKIIELIRLYSFSITGKKDDKSYALRLENIFYFESIDDKTFIYCENEVFECNSKLYEMEKLLINTGFVRISKSCILNTKKLSSVKALLNGKFEAYLNNNEKLIVNRHYVRLFKEKFKL